MELFDSAAHARRWKNGTGSVADLRESAVNTSMNIELAPDGKRVAALLPAETAEDQKAVILLKNFFPRSEAAHGDAIQFIGPTIFARLAQLPKRAL